MLGDALSFPTTSDDWVGTVVIGGALTLFSFLILPGIVVYGYLVRVARAGATGAAAPSFTDWEGLLVDGVKVFALGLAASIVVVVPIVVVGGIGGAVAGMTGNRVFGGVVALVVPLVAVALALVLGYFLPAALANFAIEDSLAAAFDLGTVVDGALTAEYATAWLLALLVGLAGNAVGSVLAVVLVGFLVLFYAQVVVAYLFGRGFASGIGEGPDDEAVGTPGTGTTPTAGDGDATADRGVDTVGRAADAAPDPGEGVPETAAADGEREAGPAPRAGGDGDHAGGADDADRG